MLGERKRFATAILAGIGAEVPAGSRVLLLLQLHGLSSKDSGPALEQFLGDGAHGFWACDTSPLGEVLSG